MTRDEETLLRWYLSRLHPDSGFQDRTNTVFDEWYQFRFECRAADVLFKDLLASARNTHALVRVLAKEIGGEQR